MLQYPATRYEPSPLVDLSDKSERARLSRSALRAFFNIMQRWSIRDADARELLGGIASSTFYDYKRSPDRVLDQDRLMRISYLVGIFKALHILHGEDLADRWVADAQSQPHLRRQIAPRLHAPGWRSGDADGAAAAGRAPGRRVRLPPSSPIERRDTHRLIPSKHGESVLAQIADDDAHLARHLRSRPCHQRASDRRECPAAGDRHQRAGLRCPALSDRQCRFLPRPSPGQPLRRSRSRRMVRGLRARDGPGRGDLP